MPDKRRRDRRGAARRNGPSAQGMGEGMPVHDHIDNIRLRPGMYVGDVKNRGIAHLVWELVSNSIDEHLAGRCGTVAVAIEADGRIVVDDDGGGIPLHAVGGVSFPELALTTIHATATLDGHRPHEHVGRNCVGLVVVNALSTRLDLEVFRNGRRHGQAYERGRPLTRLRDLGPSSRRGTRIAFVPDATIFGSAGLDAGPVAARFQELSRLLPGLALVFADLREHRYREPRGLLGFLREESAGGTEPKPTLLADATVDEIRVEIAARWLRPGLPSDIRSYANIEPTTQGGSHVSGLLAGLVAGLRRAMPDVCRSRHARRLQEAVARHLDAVVCVRLRDPRFSGPTRERLDTPDAKAAVASCAADAFAALLQRERGLRERLRQAVERVR